MQGTFRRVGLNVWLAGLTAWVLSLAAPATAHASGWRQCADEGQVCQIDRRMVVRYGVDGQWSSRVLSGAVFCSNDLFGDPAPQQVKRCEVRDGNNPGNSGSSNPGWVFCAAEGETCHVRGSAEVRFGADRQYTTRRAYSSVHCGVESFGDPIYGQTKHCEVRARDLGSSNNAWGGANNWNDSQRWRYCAGEGQMCNLQGPGEIRFSDGRRFATRNVRGNTLCSTSVFGDPAYGVVKHCEVRASSFGGWGDNGPTEGSWTRCADEGDRCEVSGGRMQVRFGTRGRYVYRDVYGPLDCTIDAFGRDPYRGERKQCESRR